MKSIKNQMIFATFKSEICNFDLLISRLIMRVKSQKVPYTKYHDITEFQLLLQMFLLNFYVSHTVSFDVRHA